MDAVLQCFLSNLFRIIKVIMRDMCLGDIQSANVGFNLGNLEGVPEVEGGGQGLLVGGHGAEDLAVRDVPVVDGPEGGGRTW